MVLHRFYVKNWLVHCDARGRLLSGRFLQVSCAICNTNLAVTAEPDFQHEPFTMLPCGHVFGQQCLNQWFKLSREPSCPTCRRSMRHAHCGHAVPLPVVAGSPYIILHRDLPELMDQIEPTCYGCTPDYRRFLMQQVNGPRVGHWTRPLCDFVETAVPTGDKTWWIVSVTMTYLLPPAGSIESPFSVLGMRPDWNWGREHPSVTIEIEGLPGMKFTCWDFLLASRPPTAGNRRRRAMIITHPAGPDGLYKPLTGPNGEEVWPPVTDEDPLEYDDEDVLVPIPTKYPTGMETILEMAHADEHVKLIPLRDYHNVMRRMHPNHYSNILALYPPAFTISRSFKRWGMRNPAINRPATASAPEPALPQQAAAPAPVRPPNMPPPAAANPLQSRGVVHSTTQAFPNGVQPHPPAGRGVRARALAIEDILNYSDPSEPIIYPGIPEPMPGLAVAQEPEPFPYGRHEYPVIINDEEEDEGQGEGEPMEVGEWGSEDGANGEFIPQASARPRRNAQEAPVDLFASMYDRLQWPAPTHDTAAAAASMDRSIVSLAEGWRQHAREEHRQQQIRDAEQYQDPFDADDEFNFQDDF
ncbi:putative cell cycle checkpoint protein [Rosellinia necatrix]|uniref:Putative cell cycle checkpoint protein n=1 Tax=Rosellinia necatrix TaxID=77044 RepID=A0A1W2TPS6_ROSNE|nr:putative cell cycle checkpoint protein [Rosellinia necatrix]